MPRPSRSLVVTLLSLSLSTGAYADGPHKRPPPVAPVAAVDGPIVGVLPFTGSADPALLASLTDDARAAIGATAGFSAQPAHAIDDALQAAKALGLACTLDKPACAVQMGGLAGCDLVVVATVSGDASAPAIDARVYDVAALREIHAAHVSGSAMKLLAVRLLAPERERARIHVRATPDGATLLVDGVARGVLGSKTVEVKPGKHEIYVAKPGFDSKVETVDLKFDD
ncbi:MAG TPA: PEGA domain-containing protein, partial [Myxococcota bacterium]